ncbi:hypothetical protein LQW54_010148 [Pestalotiopsis sp. IQ-011]
MADPRLYLPPVLSDESTRKLVSDLSLPDPTTVKPLITTAAYHTIYLITFAADDASALHPAQTDKDGSVSLILRVAGKHIPRIKTLNEVAAMTWVRKNCKIPIPAVIRFDASENNVIGHEFTLLERVRGVSIDTIYDTLDDAKIAHLVGQLTNYLTELHRHEWTHAGGLSIGEGGGEIVPGRILAENFWQGPEIAQFWGDGESIDSLNVRGPFGSYTEYLRGHIQQYIQNIEKHDSLEWMRDMIPRLRDFLDFVDARAAELNDTKYILTHKDLHFGNVMCDPETLEITSVLDWEFAAVLPLPLWNPGGGFLWSAKDESEASFAERDRLFKDIFTKICAERDPALLADFDVKNKEPHREIAKVLNFTRAIVQVCPRGQKLETAETTWRSTVENALHDLGI